MSFSANPPENLHKMSPAHTKYFGKYFAARTQFRELFRRERLTIRLWESDFWKISILLFYFTKTIFFEYHFFAKIIKSEKTQKWENPFLLSTASL